MIFVLKWWCGEDRLHAKLLRTYTYSFHFSFFFYSHIGVQVSPIPVLEAMGAWFDAEGATARQGWLGLMGLEDSPGGNFNSSPR